MVWYFDLGEMKQNLTNKKVETKYVVIGSKFNLLSPGWSNNDRMVFMKSCWGVKETDNTKQKQYS